MMISKQILIVDDEPMICRILQDLLEDEGYKVSVCNDAGTANKKLDNEQFDLAMLDVFLSSNADGLKLAKHIHTNHNDVPVILMTGYANAVDVDISCVSGSYTCISKPFHLIDIIKAVRTITDRNHVIPVSKE
jgi:DNA-binding NtrC family response regulator